MLISSREARLLRKDKTMDPGEPQASLSGSYPGAGTKPTRQIEPGDTVGSLEVVAAPGHTPGQIALLDLRDHTLFCGDAFSTLGGVATSAKINPLFPLPAIATWHKPTALETARSAGPRAEGARAGSRLGGGESGRGDGRGDREGFLGCRHGGFARSQVGVAGEEWGTGRNRVHWQICEPGARFFANGGARADDWQI